MNVKIDASRLPQDWYKYSRYVLKKIDKASSKALSKAAQELKKATVENLKQRLPYASDSRRKPTWKRPKYNDKIYDGVRVSVREHKTISGCVWRGVHVMGTGKPGSGTYRLRFFETGIFRVAKRTTSRKGLNRGTIRALHFFSDAVKERLPKAPSVIAKALEQEIEKINSEL